jgi:hypothetical protein
LNTIQNRRLKIGNRKAKNIEQRNGLAAPGPKLIFSYTSRYGCIFQIQNSDYNANADTTVPLYKYKNTNRIRVEVFNICIGIILGRRYSDFRLFHLSTTFKKNQVI